MKWKERKRNVCSPSHTQDVTLMWPLDSGWTKPTRWNSVSFIRFKQLFYCVELGITRSVYVKKRNIWIKTVIVKEADRLKKWGREKEGKRKFFERDLVSSPVDSSVLVDTSGAAVVQCGCYIYRRLHWCCVMTHWFCNEKKITFNIRFTLPTP